MIWTGAFPTVSTHGRSSVRVCQLANSTEMAVLKFEFYASHRGLRRLTQFPSPSTDWVEGCGLDRAVQTRGESRRKQVCSERDGDRKWKKSSVAKHRIKPAVLCCVEVR
jgi:hypothetical protein